MTVQRTRRRFARDVVALAAAAVLPAGFVARPAAAQPRERVPAPGRQGALGDLPDQAYVDGVRRFFSGDIVVGRDLMEL